MSGYAEEIREETPTESLRYPEEERPLKYEDPSLLSGVYTDDNTIIGTSVRMNPPTPGHAVLIREMILQALQKNIKNVYVFLSKTNDNNSDPISCPDKIYFLEKIINSLKLQMNAEEINVIFVCTPEDDNSPFDTFYKTVRMKPDIKNLITVYGADRASTANGFKRICAEKNIIHEPDVLPRTDMDRLKNLSPEELNALDIRSVEPESMSASFVRKIVANALKGKFEDLYGSLLEPSDIDRLYELISLGLTLPDKEFVLKQKKAEKTRKKKESVESVESVEFGESESKKSKTKKKGGKRKSIKRKSIKRKKTKTKNTKKRYKKNKK